RRVMLGAGAAVAWARFAAPARAATRIKFILNWKYEGPQSYFFLAQDRGYFRDEGIDVAFDQGSGSGAAVPQVMNGAYDMGFGDINALIELAAKRNDTPIATAVLYNRPPFVIVVKANSGIKVPADLAGKTIGGAPNDAAMKLFPTFCKRANVNPEAVKITSIQPQLYAQMLGRGQVDAVFGYYTTLWFATKLARLDPANELRFMRYGDYGMDLLSNSIIVSRALVTEKPEVVRGFHRALFRGLRDTVADPDAAIAALIKREPLTRASIEKEKLLFTMKNDMSDPSIATIGLGAVDQARLAASIDIIVEANGLPRTPKPSEVFTPEFLPPLHDRPEKLI
ncbi:MAG: ABC transporter substrate-binding protein, partial [Janthinobacterium lividum]